MLYLPVSFIFSSVLMYTYHSVGPFLDFSYLKRIHKQNNVFVHSNLNYLTVKSQEWFLFFIINTEKWNVMISGTLEILVFYQNLVVWAKRNFVCTSCRISCCRISYHYDLKIVSIARMNSNWLHFIVFQNFARQMSIMCLFFRSTWMRNNRATLPALKSFYLSSVSVISIKSF